MAGPTKEGHLISALLDECIRTAVVKYHYELLGEVGAAERIRQELDAARLAVETWDTVKMIGALQRLRDIEILS